MKARSFVPGDRVRIHVSAECQSRPLFHPVLHGDPAAPVGHDLAAEEGVTGTVIASFDPGVPSTNLHPIAVAFDEPVCISGRWLQRSYYAVDELERIDPAAPFPL